MFKYAASLTAVVWLTLFSISAKACFDGPEFQDFERQLIRSATDKIAGYAADTQDPEILGYLGALSMDLGDYSRAEYYAKKQRNIRRDGYALILSGLIAEKDGEIDLALAYYLESEGRSNDIATLVCRASLIAGKFELSSKYCETDSKSSHIYGNLPLIVYQIYNDEYPAAVAGLNEYESFFLSKERGQLDKVGSQYRAAGNNSRWLRCQRLSHTYSVHGLLEEKQLRSSLALRRYLMALEFITGPRNGLVDYLALDGIARLDPEGSYGSPQKAKDAIYRNLTAKCPELNKQDKGTLEVISANKAGNYRRVRIKYRDGTPKGLTLASGDGRRPFNEWLNIGPDATDPIDARFFNDIIDSYSELYELCANSDDLRHQTRQREFFARLLENRKSLNFSFNSGD